MKQLSMRAGWAVLAAAALLAGCGGGGGDDNGDGGSDGGVPASALQSPEGLAAFQTSLNNSGTDATSAPLVLGEATLPTSDTAEPIAVN